MWAHWSVRRFLEEQGFNEHQLKTFDESAKPLCDSKGYFADDKLADLVGCQELALRYKDEYVANPAQYQSPSATTVPASS